ncbi:hypothetical protein EXU57_24145 [Segetibacter sp. 3557_3]|uniref:hypothetical protein n=1 Tax=Segetibacter sp. 3557_3 TaxID=2547429 RepID=UPI0010584B11|nr:hypothetical protein [Segetibacter sp. 3557_3]TDH18145.1 hypothetical protein EXU57_24145 [Segetibacter sp. 3557_3]
MSENEIREALSRIMSIPLEQLPHTNFTEQLAKIQLESGRVDKIISNYKTKLQFDPKTSQDKYEELQDIGRFILANGDKLHIPIPATIPEYPDFILSYKGWTIGVEHTRLMSNKGRAAYKAAKYYLAKAEDIIGKDLAHLSKTVNIFIDHSKKVIGEGDFHNRSFSVQQRNELPQIIANFIISELTGGIVLKPDFISRIEITPNQDTRVDIELAESYFTENEFSILLLERIAKKERRVDDYRNAIKVDALWLLIVIDDINSFSGFNLESATIPKIKSSNFDYILIFEKYNGTVYSLFSKTQ